MRNQWESRKLKRIYLYLEKECSHVPALSELVSSYRIGTASELCRTLRTESGLEECLFITDREEAAGEMRRAGFPVIFRTDYPYECRLFGVDLILEELGDAEYTLLNRVYSRHYGVPLLIAQTSRLLIRESVPADFDAFSKMYEEESGNPSIFPMSVNREEGLQELEAYIEKAYGFYGFGLYTVCTKEDENVIGRAGFSLFEKDALPAAEIGYLILKQYRKQGYGTEAVEALLAYAYEEQLFERIYIRAGNTCSAGIAKKLGFVLDDDKMFSSV